MRTVSALQQDIAQPVTVKIQRDGFAFLVIPHRAAQTGNIGDKHGLEFVAVCHAAGGGEQYRWAVLIRDALQQQVVQSVSIEIQDVDMVFAPGRLVDTEIIAEPELFKPQIRGGVYTCVGHQVAGFSAYTLHQNIAEPVGVVIKDMRMMAVDRPGPGRGVLIPGLGQPCAELRLTTIGFIQQYIGIDLPGGRRRTAGIPDIGFLMETQEQVGPLIRIVGQGTDTVAGTVVDIAAVDFGRGGEQGVAVGAFLRWVDLQRQAVAGDALAVVITAVSARRPGKGTLAGFDQTAD